MNRPGKCVHFNGTQNRRCTAGIEYEVQFGKAAGIFLRMPCLQSTGHRRDGKWELRPVDRQGQQEIECPEFRLPTQAELDAAEREREESAARMRTVMAVVGEWRRQPPKGKETVIPCPTGCGGKLHLSQSAYNGHVHGACSTRGCVAWME